MLSSSGEADCSIAMTSISSLLLISAPVCTCSRLCPRSMFRYFVPSTFSAS